MREHDDVLGVYARGARERPRHHRPSPNPCWSVRGRRAAEAVLLMLATAGLLLATLDERVVPRWHTTRVPQSLLPICDPYPGCAAPDVPKHLCPFTWLGEMCTMIRHAQALGMRRDALIVEVGSAKGYGIWIARHFGHPILGFECRTEEHERLRQQFAGDARVKVVHACVGSTPGHATLYHALDSSSMLESEVKVNAKVNEKRSMDRNASEEVRVVTLDDQLSAVAVLNQTVGIVAIDVQGAEPLVLRGAKEIIARHRPLVMYEDTELRPSDRIGRLFEQVLSEMGPTAPEYYPCYCERDCMCLPRGLHNHEGNSTASKHAVDGYGRRIHRESQRPQ